MWFLAPEYMTRYERAAAGGFQPTPEQNDLWAASFSDISGSDTPRLLTIAGDTAEIAITGILTAKPDFFAFLFGGGNTTYADILTALAFAEQSDSVNSIVLKVDSPGGQIVGLFEVIDAIHAATKPTTTNARVALSAAYALASQADTLIAENRAAMFGSIGVVQTFAIDDNEISVTSTDAPNKRPDVTTEAGREVVRVQLDAIHDIFVQSIARGRDTTAKNVNKTFGRGSNVLAEDALAAGMIDKVGAGAAQSAITAQPTTASATVLPTAAAAIDEDTEVKIMNLAELRAAHPALVAEIEAAATIAATTAERDRVTAHLTMGEATGGLETAIAAVKDGSAMTATHTAEYMAAGMKKASATAAADDDDAAAKALEDAGGESVVSATDTDGITEEVCAAVERMTSSGPEAVAA